MPLYSDPGYFYSSGSSQLYSPYYTSSLYQLPSTSSSSSAYAPYTSSYSRNYSGSYIVPLTPPRTPTYTSSYSSRYQPKLTTITETSPLISSSRHGGLLPLTRIQSPKVSSYSVPTSSASTLPKYVAPRPIPINTADIDVSSSRYRQHQRAEAEAKQQKEAEEAKRNSLEKKRKESGEDKSTDANNKRVRSTIKRDRPVVRLSTVRSRSKDRDTKSGSSDSYAASPEPNSKIFNDLPRIETDVNPDVPMSWRQKLADDLAAIPVYPAKKSPGDLMRERYLIQNDEDNSVKPPQSVLKIKEDDDAATAEPVIDVVVDPVDLTVRRLSIPHCPTFHDICEDISSDKIDDDLNAGALRRRASLIQEQEQELLNQLQKSASGTFQLIHLERQESHDSLADEAHRQSTGKRKSKKGKKIRHKITAIVEVENAPPLPILQEKEEPLPTPAGKETAPKPKFTFNVESVEEHHEIHKVFKLPKKKSVKKVPKVKEVALPEGFMHAKPKVKSSPKAKVAKKEAFISTAEIFTFDDKTVEKNKEENKEDKTEKMPEEKDELDTKVTDKKEGLKTATSLDFGTKETPIITSKLLEKSKSLNTEELKSPTTPTKPAESLFSPFKIKEEPNYTLTPIKTTVKSSKADEFKSPLSPTKPKIMSTSPATLSKDTKPTEKASILTTSVSLDASTESLSASKTLQKTQSLNAEVTLPSLPKPPPSKTTEESVQKSDSGEDFWAQIGARETLYMTNRKMEQLEKMWQKREELLQSQATESVKNLEDIKTAVTTLKEDELKKAESDIAKSTEKTIIGRSQSTESTLVRKSDKALEALKAKEVKVEPKSPGVSKPHEISKKSNEMKAETVKSPTTPTATFTTDETPKINSGQMAKSPEQHEAASEFTTASSNNNNNKTISADKDKLSISSKATTSPNFSENANDAAKNIKSLVPTATKTTSDIPPMQTTVAPTPSTPTTPTTPITTAATKHQQEIKSPKLSEVNKKSNVVGDKVKSPPTSAKAKIVGKAATKASPTTAIAAAKAKSSPPISTVTPINADQFITAAPAKAANAATSPTKVANKSATSPKAATTVTAVTDKAKTKATTATTIATAAAATKPTATATATTAATAAATTTTPATATATGAAPTAAATVELSAGGGNNLSKFATVQNLAQCLQDVDADLEDYIPSSAENSDDDDLTDDSSYDYSSADGCEFKNLSASMKKKLRQRRKKEKQAEQARFDPQKKIKIDTTNKCYVKDEAPRYPLVATPRPLWKREKVVYPDEDSEDESDSDESGSTEETEDSEECSTSDEDELSGTGGGRGGDSGAASSTTSKENSAIIRMSTCSNDSGFEGGTAPSSPKKMLECDVNCHKKCERLTANLCGVNQKLIVEALAYVKRGARENRESPSTPPSSNPAYKIEANDEHDETSYTYSQFQKSGRFTPPATLIPRFKNYSVDDFHFLAVLGKGSFGKVLLAELRDTTYYYAVKCLKKDVVLEDDDVDSTLIERKVLALGTKHPYLCHLFCTFQTESHLFFVMEYLNGGDLMFHIQESGRFTEERARFYGAEIISGLKFLHKKGIIYRDLKLDNVLLDYEGHVRIADFGMCKLQIYLDKTADSFCGTPDYMAPEIIKGEKYNQNVDWWSFGVLLYEMLIGQSPFSGCDEDELFWSICNEIPWFPVYISAEATGILKGLLEKDYTKRIGSQYSPAGDIADHIFFRPIDWNLLEKRQVEPPFKPQVKHPLDTQYFDRVFTRERVRLTPIDKDILQSMDQKQFLGFTYTNPHITLD